jgi:uncharacterized protein (DUF736 family)
MIDTIQKTCKILSSAPLTVQEVANKLGTLVQDQGGDSSLVVRLDDKDFSTALVARRFHSQEPAHVQLTLTKPSRLTVEDLRRAFGVWSELPSMNWNAPQEIIFYVDLLGTPRTCAIIAGIEPGEQGLEDGTVMTLSVRRDVRL